VKRILVATDFSPRSDRALRRATLLAKQLEATLSLVHVVDDDRPKRMVDSERESASMVLEKQARSLREVDGVDCIARVVLGRLADEIVKAAEESAADVLILGSHRHRALQDVFLGTTAERTIRVAGRPLVVANGVPAGFYRNILVAIDLSEWSAAGLRVIADVGLGKQALVSVVHVFDAPARNYLSLTSAGEQDLRDYLAGERARAAKELASFLRDAGFAPAHQVLKPNETNAAHVICTTAREVAADLIVVGTHGRTGIAKLLLGSVAQEVLHIAEQDVLAIPPRRNS
jgi:nucleotide-binding universal stress UspA family protein